MTENWISATFECKKCGGNVLRVPDNATNESRVNCISCGIDVGSWGEVRATPYDAGKEIVRKEVKDMLRSALKGSKNIRLK